VTRIGERVVGGLMLVWWALFVWLAIVTVVAQA
jgi:hypothetical protein